MAVPTKEEEVRRALAEIGVDPALVDPLRVLAGIAANGRMPPTARVAACKGCCSRCVTRTSAEDSAVAGSDLGQRANSAHGRSQSPLMDNDAIPTIGSHRGVWPRGSCNPARGSRLVRAEIDRVLGMSDPGELADYAGSPWHAPEVAAARGRDGRDRVDGGRRDARTSASGISLEQLRACVAGLGSRTWRDPTRYCSLLDHDGIERDEPLIDPPE